MMHLDLVACVPYLAIPVVNDESVHLGHSIEMQSGIVLALEQWQKWLELDTLELVVRMKSYEHVVALAKVGCWPDAEIGRVENVVNPDGVVQTFAFQYCSVQEESIGRSPEVRQSSWRPGLFTAFENEGGNWRA